MKKRDSIPHGTPVLKPINSFIVFTCLNFESARDFEGCRREGMTYTYKVKMPLKYKYTRMYTSIYIHVHVYIQHKCLVCPEMILPHKSCPEQSSYYTNIFNMVKTRVNNTHCPLILYNKSVHFFLLKSGTKNIECKDMVGGGSYFNVEENE